MTVESPQQQNGIRMVFDGQPEPTGAKIKVIGVGGGGGNAVNRMIEAGVKNIEFIVANTDLQDLNLSNASIKIQLGNQLTRGLGAGANPGIGREAALEDTEKIIESLQGADMVFVTTGLGGGTGTGAAPVIAALAMELEILTVAVVTKPFKFEGRRRMQQAEQGLAELRGCVDTIITIPNAKLKEVEEKISITDAFKRADDILLQAVEGISNLITIPGLINLDFADVKSVMERMGMALMGVGRARGEGSAMTAMKAAIDSKLLEENSIRGARGALVNITCGKDMPLDEIEEAVELIHEEADDDANIIFGAVIEESLKDEVKVTVIATGFDREAAASAMPAYAPSVATPPIPMRPATENPLHKKPKVEDLDIPTFIRKQAD